MPSPPTVDDTDAPAAGRVRIVHDPFQIIPPPEPAAPAAKPRTAATAFVESCLETVAGSVVRAELKSRGRPRAKRLVKALAHKKHVLITTHLHPDPDALASSQAMLHLLRTMLPGATVDMSIKGKVAGGINAKFAELSELDLVPWDDDKLASYDAYVLLDTQPASAYCPLPKTIDPTAVIDHHRGRHAKPDSSFCDVRVDVGATSSIIFSYLMELEVDIHPKLAASLLFAIESDLAGAAGTPGDLDNIALSNLVLLADTSVLYRMRYVDLPQSYYQSYAAALNNAVFFDHAIVSHLDTIDSLEKPAVMADFLLRLDTVEWSLVTAVHETRLIMSLRTSGGGASAVEVMRKLVKSIGEGGGHRLKAGGYVPLTTGSAAEIIKARDGLRRRLLRVLKVKHSRGTRLVCR